MQHQIQSVIDKLSAFFFATDQCYINMFSVPIYIPRLTLCHSKANHCKSRRCECNKLRTSSIIEQENLIRYSKVIFS